MCNLSDLVEERGIARGKAEGRAEERARQISPFLCLKQLIIL